MKRSSSWYLPGSPALEILSLISLMSPNHMRRALGERWFGEVIHGSLGFYIYYFVLLMKSHLQSYPCPLQINSFWNLGFLLGITIILQIITGIFLGLHYTSDLNSAYSSVFFFIREIYYGWCLRYLHSSGASFVQKVRHNP